MSFKGSEQIHTCITWQPLSSQKLRPHLPSSPKTVSQTQKSPLCLCLSNCGDLNISLASSLILRDGSWWVDPPPNPCPPSFATSDDAELQESTGALRTQEQHPAHKSLSVMVLPGPGAGCPKIPQWHIDYFKLKYLRNCSWKKKILISLFPWSRRWIFCVVGALLALRADKQPKHRAMESRVESLYKQARKAFKNSLPEPKFVYIPQWLKNTSKLA